MIKFFVKHPVTTLMLTLVFVILGIVSFFNVPIEDTPRVDFPIVTVKVVYPGASPIEVEQQIIKKVEDAVSEISEIKKINANAYENFAFIFIEFNLGVSVNTKSIEVKDKVDAIVQHLPAKAEKPIIEKFDPMVKAVAELVLLSDGTRTQKELYEYADKKLRTQLASLKGVASIELMGGRERQINIIVDARKLANNYASITDIIQALTYKNLNVPGGMIDKGNQSFTIRFVGEYEKISEILQTEIPSREGTSFKLSEVARLEDGAKDAQTLSRYNGKDVVALSLMKASDGNAVSVVKGIRKALPKLTAQLPKGYSIELAANSATKILEETSEAIKNIIFGIILTVLILFIFTSNLKVTFISTLVIPTSLIATFLLVDLSNFTVNMMTLMAVGTALGTLIANAIVIIESIMVKLDEGKSPVEAAITGTEDVAVAVLASTLTNIVVFTPIGFMGGIVGQFMKQFGLTVVYTTIFSLITTFTLTPMLCGLFLKHKSSKSISKFEHGVNHFMNFLSREYGHILDFILKYKKTTIFLTLFILYSIKFIIPYIGNDFFPLYDQDKINLSLTLPKDSTLERSSKTAKKIEEQLRQIPEVTNVLTTIGKNGVENTSMIVDLTHSTKRSKSDLQIINQLIPFLAKIPDAEISMARGDAKGGAQSDMTIDIFGADYEQMVVNAEEMAKIMVKSGYFRSLSLSHKTPKTEVRFIPDSRAMLAYGLSNAQVAQTIRASIYGDDSNIFRENGEEYPINIELAESFKLSPEDISKITVVGPKGLIPVSKLGSVKFEESIPPLIRRDKKRVIRIESFLSKSTSGEVQRFLINEFKNIKFARNAGYHFTGNAEMQEESGREIGKAFLLATILTYMVLAALMNSLSYPFIIASSVAMGMIGVFLFLFFIGHSVNIGSMLAIVMLVGLVVNNAILLIDLTLTKIKLGLTPEESLHIAGRERLKPILMTTIAIIAGTLPQLFTLNLAKASMASVMIGGMIASTIFTFVLVPPLIVYLERLLKRIQRAK